MIVRMGLIQRLPELSLEEFRSHWLGPHGAAAAQMPWLRRYQQNHVYDDAQRAIAYARGPWRLDGFSQLWFDDLASMRQAIGSPAYAGVASDTPDVMIMPGLLACEPNVVVEATRPTPPLVKRMSILRRRLELSPEDFRREWTATYAELVRRLLHLAGYIQNVVVARELRPNEACGYAELPIDGVVELWFPDLATIDEAFASVAGRAAMAHAKTFLAEITTYLVEPHTIFGNN